jgi:hypothetical protein
MNIINAPSVYLAGKQELNSLDCAEFLEAHNVEYWNSDTDNASEHLVEIAGRLCYMSFAKPRPGGNQAYIAVTRSSWASKRPAKLMWIGWKFGKRNNERK